MTLPERFKNRWAFTLTGGVLGAIFAHFYRLIYPSLQSDHMPAAIGAIIAGAAAACLLWPRSRPRRTLTMIMIGFVVMVILIVSAHFAIGFFSEREISARAAGGAGEWVGSFLGAWIMAAFLGFFTIIGSFFLILLPGPLAAWLFRDQLKPLE